MEFAFDHYEVNGQVVEGGPTMSIVADENKQVIAFYRQVVNPDTLVATVGSYTAWLSAEAGNYYVKNGAGAVVATGFATADEAVAWIYANQSKPSLLPLFGIGGFVLYIVSKK